jgi:branched-chain amino acid transport system substrate-binding protein
VRGADGGFGGVEDMLREFSLSTKEGLALMVMADAMVKAGSPEPDKYLPVLAKTAGYKGVTGTISFDPQGDIKNGALTLFTYKAGKRAELAVIP